MQWEGGTTTASERLVPQGRMLLHSASRSAARLLVEHYNTAKPSSGGCGGGLTGETCVVVQPPHVCACQLRVKQHATSYYTTYQLI